MKKKLLAVHPSFKYDRFGLSRVGILDIASGYEKEDLFVVYNKRSRDFSKYLGRDASIRNVHFSEYGNISDESLLGRLLDSDELLICGHTHNACHDGAYESVLDYAKKTGLDMNVVLPTYAIALADFGVSCIGGIMTLENVESIFPRFYTPEDGIDFGNLSGLQKATLVFMELYVRRAMWSGANTEIRINDVPVAHVNNPAGTKWIIDFKNPENAKIRI